jgi:IS5 family transposase
VKAHQHSSGAIGDYDQAIGKPVAGNTTKIHTAVESNGMPIEFEITGGQVQDCKVAPELIELLPHSEYKIADKGYDSEELRQQIREQNSIPITSRKSNSTIGNKSID